MRGVLTRKKGVVDGLKVVFLKKTAHMVTDIGGDALLQRAEAPVPRILTLFGQRFLAVRMISSKSVVVAGGVRSDQIVDRGPSIERDRRALKDESPAGYWQLHRPQRRRCKVVLVVHGISLKCQQQ